MRCRSKYGLLWAVFGSATSHDMEGWRGEFHRLDRNRDNRIDLEEAQRMGYTKDHLLYYDGLVNGKDGVSEKDGVLDIDEAVAFIRERTLYKQADFSGPDPKGHLQPLGSHAPPGKPPDEFTAGNFPSPEVFWRRYVDKHRIAVFRGAVARAQKLWSEEYVRKTYGWVDVKLEPKKEARLEVGAYKDVEDSKAFRHHRTTLEELLQLSGEGKNIYAVSILPQAMAWEIDIPWSFLCGGRTVQFEKHRKTMVPHPYPHPTAKNYLTHFLEANLWVTNGYTRSQLHYDKENIVLCLAQGQKEFIFIDTRKYGHKIPWARGGKYNVNDDLQNSWTDWITVNPDRVDMRLYSFLREIEYMNVTLNGGDCVFMPFSMLHQVTSNRKAENPDKAFQVAASFHFDPTERFDAQACQHERFPRGKDVPFAAFDILWYYDGTGVIPQGYPLPHEERAKVIDMMGRMRAKGLTKKIHRRIIRDGYSDSAMRSSTQEIDGFWKDFNNYAADKKMGLQPDEMNWNNTPVELWLRWCARADGMLPCDHGKYYSPRTPEVWNEMEAWLLKSEEAWLAKKADGKGEEL